MADLANRTAIVTGAGRGVGLATALRLAGAGVRVVVNDLDATEADECVRLVEAAGGQALACPGDVTAAEVPQRLVDAALEGFGGIDIVVNLSLIHI